MPAADGGDEGGGHRNADQREQEDGARARHVPGYRRRSSRIEGKWS
jgi:hypothetical protein